MSDVEVVLIAIAVLLGICAAIVVSAYLASKDDYPMD